MHLGTSPCVIGAMAHSMNTTKIPIRPTVPTIVLAQRNVIQKRITNMFETCITEAQLAIATILAIEFSISLRDAIDLVWANQLVDIAEGK